MVIRRALEGTKTIRLLATAKRALYVINKDYGHGVLNGYWPKIAPILKELKAAIKAAESK